MNWREVLKEFMLALLALAIFIPAVVFILAALKTIL